MIKYIYIFIAMVAIFTATMAVNAPMPKTYTMTNEQLWQAIDSCMENDLPKSAADYVAELDRRFSQSSDSRGMLRLLSVYNYMYARQFEDYSKSNEAMQRKVESLWSPLKDVVQITSYPHDVVSQVRNSRDVLKAHSIYELVDTSQVLLDMNLLDFVMLRNYQLRRDTVMMQQWFADGSATSRLLYHMLRASDGSVRGSYDSSSALVEADQMQRYASSRPARALAALTQASVYLTSASEADNADLSDTYADKALACCNSAISLLGYSESDLHKADSSDKMLAQMALRLLSDLNSRLIDISVGDHIPFSDIPVSFHTRNLSQVSLDVYNWCERFDPSRHSPCASFTVDLPRLKGRMQYQATTWHAQGLKAGRYIAVAHVDSLYEYCDFRISNIGVVSLDSPGDRFLSVVNATSGAPLIGATVDGKSVDAMGMLSISSKRGERHVRFADEQLTFSLWSRTSRFNVQKEERTVVLADRGLYRPGQKLRFKMWRCWADYCKVWPLPSDSYKVALVGDKEIASVDVTTGVLGSAWGEMLIPSDVKTGHYRITVNGTYATDVSVEEYKLTGNHIVFDEVTEAYLPGDTVIVGGRLLTVDDLPVSGALVVANDSTELVTDADGHFSYSFVASLSQRYPSNYIFHRVHVKATDRGGETVEDYLSVTILSSGYRPDIQFAHGDMNEFSLFAVGSDVSFTLSLVNGMDKVVPGNVHYYVERYIGSQNENVDSFSEVDDLSQCQVVSQAQMFLADEQTVVIKTDGFAPGLYRVRAVAVGKDGHEVSHAESFTLLPRSGSLLHDGRPVSLLRRNVCAMGGDSFIPGREYRFSVGTVLADAYIYVLAETGGEVVYRDVVRCSQEMKEISFTVSDSVPRSESMHIVLYTMKDGAYYDDSMDVDRHEDESDFVLSMLTMRDKSQPGARESVTMKLKSDFSLADAEVAATMFDSRLDNIFHYRWNFEDRKFRPSVVLSRLFHSRLTPYDKRFVLTSSAPGRCSSSLLLEGASWLYNIVELVSSTIINHRDYMPQMKRRLFSRAAGTSLSLSADEEYVEEEADAVFCMQEPLNAPPVPPAPKMMTVMNVVDAAQSSNVTLRNNFTESVFFEPSLRPDADGNVEVSFTLPDNVTKYNFMAFATDKQMRASYLFAQMKVSMPLAVKAWLPRQLYVGDSLVVSLGANVDEAFNVGKISYSLSCDEDASVSQIDESHFRIVAPEGVDSLHITFTASDGKFSDGERHAIPVVSRFRQIDESQAFIVYPRTSPVLANDGYTELNLTTATWEAVLSALPHLYDDRYPCSDTYAGQIETSAIAMAFQRRGDVADWLSRHQDDKDNRAASLLKGDVARRMFADAVLKLKNMQLSDGSFPWLTGMDGSEYMTRSIVNTLLDVRRYTSLHDELLDAMIDNALSYIVSLVHRTADYWTEHKIESPVADESLLFDLYILAHAGRLDMSDASISRAVAAIPKAGTLASPSSKALAAVIYDCLGRRSDANLLVQSVCENLIRPDEYTAHVSLKGHFWYADDMFVHPVLVMALNDLQLEIGDAQRICNWMMKAKRSTHWSNTQSTSRAVFALLSMASDHRDAKTSLSILHADDSQSQLSVTSELSVDASNVKSVTVNHNGALPVWGNWHRSLFLPVDSMPASNQPDISIVRTVEDAHHVGDKVRITLTVTTAVDMDFVRISDYRPASFQPVDQSSGYRGWWWWRSCAVSNTVVHYYSPRDAAVDLFVERLPRGTHSFTYECYVTNAGELNAGYAEAVCMYDDALQAHTAGQRISISD